MRRTRRWLEISLDYRCNCRCVGCFSSDGSGSAMTTREAVEMLATGRRAGATRLWIGGGEPTLRNDLLMIVKAARRLGYRIVKLQTNGMMLARAAFAERCVRAGVTDISFLLTSSESGGHDRWTRTPGSHELLLRGIGEARRRGLRLMGDILVSTKNVADLPQIVSTYRELGVLRFWVWLFSAAVDRSRNLGDLIPHISHVVAAVGRAMALEERPDFITSLHTPPCTVPEEHHACLFDVAGFGMLVGNPGGDVFPLEQSPVEGGVYLPSCVVCTFRDRCNGLRADYLAVHGEAEFQPVTATSSG